MAKIIPEGEMLSLLREEKIKDYSKMSFLSFIIKFVEKFGVGFIEGLVVELCLENCLLFENTKGQIMPFSHELRKKILKEIYNELDTSINSPKFFVTEENIIWFASNTFLLLELISIKEICILAFSKKEEGHNSEKVATNFFKLYCQALKNFNLRNYYQNEKFYMFLKHVLVYLYEYYSNLVLNERLEGEKDPKHPFYPKSFKSNCTALINPDEKRRGKFEEMWERVMNPLGRNDDEMNESTHNAGDMFFRFLQRRDVERRDFDSRSESMPSDSIDESEESHSINSGSEPSGFESNLDDSDLCSCSSCQEHYNEDGNEPLIQDFLLEEGVDEEHGLSESGLGSFNLTGIRPQDKNSDDIIEVDESFSNDLSRSYDIYDSSDSSPISGSEDQKSSSYSDWSLNEESNEDNSNVEKLFVEQ